MFNIISKFQNDYDKEVDINEENEINEEKVDEVNEETVDEVDVKEDKVEVNEDKVDEVEIKEDKVKINDSDSDEDNENIMYVISIDNVPYYYHKDLVLARKNMWKLAHKYIISDEDDEIGISNDKYIMTNNPNNIQIVSPLDFLFFRYSNVLHVLKIDYILPF